jgi:uncharacterized integral membrane protein
MAVVNEEVIVDEVVKMKEMGKHLACSNLKMIIIIIIAVVAVVNEEVIVDEVVKMKEMGKHLACSSLQIKIFILIAVVAVVNVEIIEDVEVNTIKIIKIDKQMV